MSEHELDKFLNERLASIYDLRCIMCSKGKEPNLANRTTSAGDSVCEDCYREFEIALQFADEPELDAYFEGTANEGFTRRVERWWKWHEEN